MAFPKGTVYGIISIKNEWSNIHIESEEKGFYIKGWDGVQMQGGHFGNDPTPDTEMYLKYCERHRNDLPTAEIIGFGYDDIGSKYLIIKRQ